MKGASGFVARLVFRIPFFALGLAAIIWGAWMFPGFLRGMTIERMAAKIIMFEPYKIDQMNTVLAFNNIVVPPGLCRPSNDRAAAIIQLKVFETTFEEGSGEDLDREQQNLTDRLARAFECAPADPYLMLALFWQRNLTTGLDAKSLAFLDWSYRMGPNEGWVAFRRNRLAAVLLPNVPPAMAETILTEYKRLLASQFVLEAVDTYRASDTETRKRLFAQAASVDDVTRRYFYAQLRNAELEPPELRLPDSELRPWQRR